jgi:hypothetical protein
MVELCRTEVEVQQDFQTPISMKKAGCDDTFVISAMVGRA